MDLISPVHPGEVLMDEFLEPLGLSQHRLAVEIGVPPRRINEIVHGKAGSPRTPPFGWLGSSARVIGSG